jgi:hypothetical protein
MKKLPKNKIAALAAALCIVPVGPWAQDLPALAAPAAPVAQPAAPEKNAAEGVSASVKTASQGNFGKLSIGVGYVGSGAYLDEKGAKRSGLHASLEIAVEDEPDKFSQPDVHEGQVLLVADYRVLIDKLVDGGSGRGTVILRLWPPAKVPPKAKKGWLHFFGH